MKSNKVSLSMPTLASTNGSGIKYLFPDQTSDSYSMLSSYQTLLPHNIDVFSVITDALQTLTNPTVKDETIVFLGRVNAYLQTVSLTSHATNYLSKLNLIEQDDGVVLIEWNFQNFRIGFLIEPKNEESSYYIISEDKEIGSFMAETRRIGRRYDEVIEKIVRYVLENT